MDIYKRALIRAGYKEEQITSTLRLQAKKVCFELLYSHSTLNLTMDQIEDEMVKRLSIFLCNHIVGLYQTDCNGEETFYIARVKDMLVLSNPTIKFNFCPMCGEIINWEITIKEKDHAKGLQTETEHRPDGGAIQGVTKDPIRDEEGSV